MMKYHPRSWSQQAREMCNYQIGMIEAGWNTVEFAIHLFNNSYQAPLVTNRAAKRFSRKMRTGKIKIPEKQLGTYEN